MDYTQRYTLLRAAWSPDLESITLPDSGTVVRNCLFRSQSIGRPEFRETGSAAPADLLVRDYEGNMSFTYPVFLPKGTERADGAIILLHGLNERNWSKYLIWADHLASQTGKGVILFPMAYHINRSPRMWSDPRLMSELASRRSEADPVNGLSTPLNAALSTRLDHHPEFFCTSGLQSINDLTGLARSIRTGGHPLFREGAGVDFFAYSIGAFMLEVLLIANPEGLFGESRSYLFLGGSSFDQMRGISRYIMDKQAFGRLAETYLHEDPQLVRKSLEPEERHLSNGIWTAFMAMLRLDRLQAYRERSFGNLRDRISALSMADDQVIPARAIVRTLWGANNRNRIPVRILNFPYPCSHENPFPTANPAAGRLVGENFLRIFGQASEYLA